jgi:hypothetical protein
MMPLFLFIFHSLKAQWEKPPCGAEPRIKLGPAVQQADVLPTEPRRTILSHVLYVSLTTEKTRKGNVRQSREYMYL